MKGKKNIIIIGAGLSGLSAAPLLANQGFNVTVIEKNPGFGGVAGRFSHKNFTFDSGPTWYLMPEVFDNYFALFDKNTSDYYRLINIDPSYRIFFGENDYADIRKDKKHNFAVFEKFEKGGGVKLEEYLKNSEYKYNTACAEFLYRNYNSVFDFLDIRFILEGPRLHLFKNLDSYARKYFKNKRARQILEFNTVFLGCSPEKTPALYSLMSHADMQKGVVYPEGGIYKLPEALFKLGKEYGVRYLFNSAVKKINTKNNKAVSVNTEMDDHKADIVIAACDYHHAETSMLEKKYRIYSEKYWDTRTLAPTAFIVYLGIKKKIKLLKHHNLFLADNWEEHFKSVFDKPSWPDVPSYYIGCSSKTDPDAAPKNCDSLFILVPVAPGLDDNEEIKESFSSSVMAHIEELLGESINNSIVFKKVISHSEFKNAFNYYKGTSMGLAHTLFQTALFRPSHKSKKIHNLYYTGHYTHPGIGMPMAIISSQISARLISEDYG
jgi:1-hydroxy-2-isopentenylcarotenoid 3,4-desaturase